MVSGTRWKSSVSALLELCDALFMGLLLDSLLVMNGMSRSNTNDLERLQVQALRACLGLPSRTFNVETVSEERVTLFPSQF